MGFIEWLALGELQRRIAHKPGAFTAWLRHYVDGHMADIKRHMGKDAAKAG